MGITISNITPQQVFGIQSSVWFVTVLPFMVADLSFYYRLYNPNFDTYDGIFEYVHLALCLALGTDQQNTL